MYIDKLYFVTFKSDPDRSRQNSIALFFFFLGQLSN